MSALKKQRHCCVPSCILEEIHSDLKNVKTKEDFHQILSRHRSDVCLIKNSAGVTLLHIAVGCFTFSPLPLVVVETLLDMGADVNASTVCGNTPIGFAVKYNRSAEYVKLLLRRCSKINKHEPCQSSFIRALNSSSCNVLVIQLFLEHGVDVRVINIFNGNTLLHDAVVNPSCSGEIIKALIHHGAEVNKRNPKNGQTPLISALSHAQCRLDVIETLLQHGADVNEPESKKSPFYYALLALNEKGSTKPISESSSKTLEELECSLNYKSVLSLLLKYRADPNQVIEFKGNTVLHVALKHKFSLNTIEDLLNHGADVNKFNNNGETPFGVALNKFHCIAELACILFVYGRNTSIYDTEMIYTIVEQPLDGINDWKQCYKPLFHALKNNCSLQLIVLLLNYGGDLFMGLRNISFLHLAVSNPITCQPEIICDLIERGCDVNKMNELGYTPLMLALNNPYSPSQEFLHLPDHDFNIRCMPPYKGDSPFQSFIANTNSCHLQSIQVLLEHEATINKASKDGETALMLALLNPNCTLQHISLLLDYGANVNQIHSKSGAVPLHYALANHKMSIEVFKILLRKGADILSTVEREEGTLLHFAIAMQNFRSRNLEIIKELIKGGIPIDKRNIMGYTPLIVAIMNFHGDFQLIEFLLKHGANINFESISKKTPLFYACKQFMFSTDERMALIGELIKYGADIYARTSFGETALHMVLRGNMNDRVSSVKLLMRYFLLTRPNCVAWHIHKENLEIIESKYIFSMFLGEEYSFFISEQDVLAHYIKDCMHEIVQMMNEPICPGLSLYDLVLHRSTNPCFNPILQIDMETVMRILTSKSFPLFRKMIMASIKIQETLNGFEDSQIFICFNRSTNLNLYSVLRIFNFLSIEDIFSFFQALF